jgi:hypothetical protein
MPWRANAISIQTPPSLGGETGVTTGTTGTRTRRGGKRAPLAELQRLLGASGADARRRKAELLVALCDSRFKRARDLEQLQRLACFLTAFPDDARVLRAALALAAVFHDHVRRLPRAERLRLDDSGMAGTFTRHVYAAAAARWLTARFGAHIEIDWPALTDEVLDHAVTPLLHPFEKDTVEITLRTARVWFERALAASTTNAHAVPDRVRLPATGLAWLLAQAPRDRAGAERFDAAFEAAEMQLAWDIGHTAAAITNNRVRMKPVFRPDGMRRAAADPRAAVAAPLDDLARVSRAHASRLLDAWRAALWSRTRTVLHIERPNLAECYLADFGGGLQMTAIGIEPRARGVLEASFGYLLLANGVPFGYGGFTPVFAQVNTGTNVFPEYRGSEAAFAFQQALRTMHALTGCERFLVNPYQFGAGNDEALQSRAYWFYFRLGFRSAAASARHLAQREFDRMREDRRYRVPLSTLRKLALSDMVLDLSDTAAPKFFDERWLAALARGITPALAATGVANRDAAGQALAGRIAQCLQADVGRWSAEEQRGFGLFAPLLAQVDGLAGWRDDEKRALVDLVRARWAPLEREYVNRLRIHDRLRDALARAARRS